MQNGHIRPIISENARPISINYSALIYIWVGIIDLTFVLRSLKGRCYGNQLIWGTFYKRLHWRFATECSSAICIRALTPAMMQLQIVKKMVNFGAVTPKIIFLICVPFACLLGKNQCTISVRCAGISRLVGWTRLKWRWTCTFHINLVGFYAVLLQLTWLNSVQQASIITRVNSYMSTRGQHVFFATTR